MQCDYIELKPYGKADKWTCAITIPEVITTNKIDSCDGTIGTTTANLTNANTAQKAYDDFKETIPNNGSGTKICYTFDGNNYVLSLECKNKGDNIDVSTNTCTPPSDSSNMTAKNQYDASSPKIEGCKDKPESSETIRSIRYDGSGEDYNNIINDVGAMISNDDSTVRICINDDKTNYNFAVTCTGTDTGNSITANKDTNKYTCSSQNSTAEAKYTTSVKPPPDCTGAPLSTAALSDVGYSDSSSTYTNAIDKVNSNKIEDDDTVTLCIHGDGTNYHLGLICTSTGKGTAYQDSNNNVTCRDNTATDKYNRLNPDSCGSSSDAITIITKGIAGNSTVDGYNSAVDSANNAIKDNTVKLCVNKIVNGNNISYDIGLHCASSGTISLASVDPKLYYCTNSPQNNPPPPSSDLTAGKDYLVSQNPSPPTCTGNNNQKIKIGELISYNDLDNATKTYNYIKNHLTNNTTIQYCVIDYPDNNGGGSIGAYLECIPSLARQNAIIDNNQVCSIPPTPTPPNTTLTANDCSPATSDSACNNGTTINTPCTDKTGNIGSCTANGIDPNNQDSTCTCQAQVIKSDPLKSNNNLANRINAASPIKSVKKIVKPVIISTPTTQLVVNLPTGQKVLGASDAGISVQTSGHYVFTANGQVIAQKDVVINGTNVSIKLFQDKHGDNIHHNDEPYIGDYANIKITNTESVQSYTLNSGWNLINIPVIDVTKQYQTVADLMKYWNKQQQANIKSIAKFDNGAFNIYTNSDSGSNYSAPFNIVPGEALFVLNLGDNITVTFPGNAITSNVPVSLNNGWNLVGIISTQKYTGESLLQKINSSGYTADTCSDFSNGTYQSLIIDQGTTFGNSFNVLPTKGYFIRVNSSTSKSNTFTP